MQALNKDLVFAQFWLNRDDPFDEQYRRGFKCAEVLVPDSVGPGLLIGFYVANQRALAAFKKLGTRLPVVCSSKMSIMHILVGDLLKSKAQTLINTVNCVGVMGKGIALEFKNRFPDMYEDYTKQCQRGEVKPGIPYLYKTLFPPQIVNFPTKDHWKSLSKLNDIERGLKHLSERYKEWGITSLAISPLGCGNGQLEWRAVGPLIYRFMKEMDIPVEMYAPYGTNPKELTVEFLEQGADRCVEPAVKAGHSALNPAWVALVEILDRIEQQPYHWPVGRTLF